MIFRTPEVAGFWSPGEGTLALKIPTSLPMSATAFFERIAGAQASNFLGASGVCQFIITREQDAARR